MRSRCAVLVVVLLGASPAAAQDRSATVDELIRDLHHRDEDRRSRAVRRLGGVGLAAVPSCVRLLTHRRGVVRGAAVEALALIGAPAVPALKKLLGRRRAPRRWNAARVLGLMGPRADLLQPCRGKKGRAPAAPAPALAALSTGLADADPLVRQECARALTGMGRVAVPALRRAVKDRDAGVRWAAARALSRLGHHVRPTTGVPPYTVMQVTDRDLHVVRHGWIHRRVTFPLRVHSVLPNPRLPLAAVLLTPNPSADDSGAVTDLHLLDLRTGKRRRVPLRRPSGYFHADEVSRIWAPDGRAAAVVLESYGPLGLAHADRLARWIGGGRGGWRRLSLPASGATVDPARFYSLLGWASAGTVAFTTGCCGTFGYHLHDARQDQSRVTHCGHCGHNKYSCMGRWRAALLSEPVSTAGATAATPRKQQAKPPVAATATNLRQNLEHGSCEVRTKAMEALVRLRARPPWLVSELRQMMRYTCGHLDAVTALASLGPQALPALIEGLSSRYSVVRQGAAEALGKQGKAARGAAPRIARLLADEDDSTAEAAASALARLGKVGLRHLIRALGSRRAAVRVKAAEALATLGPAAIKAKKRLRRCLRHRDEEVRSAAADALEQIAP